MSSKDYYKILGVEKQSSQEEIKKAYRKLAMQNHPDKHKDEKEKYEKKFKEITEAYEILNDTNKRAQYDRFGDSAFQGGKGGNGFSGGFQGGFDFNFGDFSDVFNDFFNHGNMGGSKKKKNLAEKGADLKYNLNISLEDSFYAREKIITYRTMGECTVCHGSGSNGGSNSKSECPDCHGTGKTRIQQGFFIVEQICHRCGGSGVIIQNPCQNCNGTGQKAEQKSLNIKIPRGIYDNASLQFDGCGEAGKRGGKTGSLFVAIHIEPHKVFKRVGDNLHCEIPISFAIATLGGEMKIRGIDAETITFDIPAGIEYGRQLMIKGEGMPIYGSTSRRGDIIITVKIETPKNLTSEQKHLIKQFDELSNSKNNPNFHNFFDKIRDLF